MLTFGNLITKAAIPGYCMAFSTRLVLLDCSEGVKRLASTNENEKSMERTIILLHSKHDLQVHSAHLHPKRSNLPRSRFSNNASLNTNYNS